MKRIAILGSTGSIGCNALEVARHLPEDFTISVLVANQNADLLEKQAKEFRPKIVALFDKEKALELQKKLPGIEVLGGMEGILAAAAYDESDIVLSAIAGTMGLAPTVAAIQAGKTIALANKEALVSGGQLVTSLAKQKKVSIIPIDSEHSAIFQCLNGEEKKNVRRIILTASGGPFRDYDDTQLEKVSIKHALEHPTWKMGPKVTIDCSTLMNKGLEVIETHWLFDVPIDQIEVVIHPQSVIHSMIEYCDGSMLAQMSQSDMRVPIQYAMTYPQRKKGLIPPFDFLKNQTLQFYYPNNERFRCLRLAYDAIKQGKSLPCYMNAANEVLVGRFLENQISWKEISSKLEHLMQKHQPIHLPCLDDILCLDKEARLEAAKV